MSCIEIDPARKVYVAIYDSKKDEPKMHLKFKCPCLTKTGYDTVKVYVTQAEARETYHAKAFCKRCSK